MVLAVSTCWLPAWMFIRFGRFFWVCLNANINVLYDLGYLYFFKASEITGLLELSVMR